MSIDKHLRTPGIDWWEEEELSIPEFYQVLDNYESIKPNIIISHDCPTEVFNIKDTSRTRQFMDTMLEIHRPKLWIFGHHHMSINKNVNNTNYICLNELETYIIKI